MLPTLRLLAARGGDQRIDAAEVEQSPAKSEDAQGLAAPLVNRLPLDMVVALPSNAPSENLG